MILHWVDYVIIGVIALSVITGLFRGFIKELVALCVWALALWLAFKYSAQLELWLRDYIQDKTARAAVAFIAILIGTIIAGGLFNAILSFILKSTGLSGPDRLLGMGFGFVRGIFIVALVMVIMKMTSVPVKEYSDKSQLYAKFDPVVNWLYGYMPGLMDQVGVLSKPQKSMKLDTNDIYLVSAHPK